MNVGHPIIGFDIANSHRDDLLREAAKRRLVSAAHREHDKVGVWRHRIGDALVRAGERLQGARRSRAAEELGAAPGALYLAR
jgi:hypothetical protein